MESGGGSQVKGSLWAAALILAWLGLLFIPEMWPPSKADPCSRVSILKKTIEQDRRERIADGIERKKQALDDQLDKLQMSPEQYRRLQEKYQKIDRDLAPLNARAEALAQEELARNVKLLTDAEAACKAAKER